MRKRQDKKSTKQKLINLLQHRIRLLEIEKQNYEHNPTLIMNVKLANVEIIKNDIENLRHILNQLMASPI